MPLPAAWMGVPYGASMSMPGWPLWPDSWPIGPWMGQIRPLGAGAGVAAATGGPGVSGIGGSGAEMLSVAGAAGTTTTCVGARRVEFSFGPCGVAETAKAPAFAGPPLPCPGTRPRAIPAAARTVTSEVARTRVDSPGEGNDWIDLTL